MILPRISPSLLQRNEQLFGPFFVGMIVNYLCWGVQVSQTHYYYKTYRKTDGAWFLGVVAFLFIINALQTVSVTEGIWNFLVEQMGDPNPGFLSLALGLKLIALGDAVIASTVHILYAQKIWALLEPPYNSIFTILVLLFSLCQLASGIGCTVITILTDVTLSSFDRVKLWGYIWIISASVTNVLITSVIGWKLCTIRTGFRRNDDLIPKLFQTAAETALAPTVLQLLDLIIFFSWPTQTFHVALTLIIPKVYSTSAMALLNSRRLRKPAEKWKGRGEGLMIHTTKSVVVAGDYALASKAKAADLDRDYISMS